MCVSLSTILILMAHVLQTMTFTGYGREERKSKEGHFIIYPNNKCQKSFKVLNH